MQGPDLKVGKTDIIDANGTRVVTETTNQNTLDGKSIWTISQEFDYDNDGTMDAFKKTTQTYDANTGKLLEETSTSNEWHVKGGDKNKAPYTSHNQYLYETGTNNLVKVNHTYDHDSDGEPENQTVTRYEYNDKGQVIKESEFNKANDNTKGYPNTTTSYTYHKNGKIKTEVKQLDFNADGKFKDIMTDGKIENNYNEDGKIVTASITHPNGYTYEAKFDKNEKKISAVERGADGAVVEIKYDENEKVISKTVIKEPDKPVAQEEPAKAEEKQGYEIPTYKPYSQDNDKKHPPMMGI